MDTPSYQTALELYQQTLLELAISLGIKVPHQASSGQQNVLQLAQRQVGCWPTKGMQIQPLQLIFDAISLSQGASAKHTWPAKQLDDLSPSVLYPTSDAEATSQLVKLQNTFKEELRQLSESDWNSLPVLSIFLEKYGSYISCGDKDIALNDLVKMTAAIATALSHNPDAENFCLIAGDLSGVQDFIYTISSDGALKSLRARSFYLELVTEEVVRQLLERLGLPRTSVIYAGGGNLYVLAPKTEDVGATVEQLRRECNAWLLEKFQKKVFLGLVTQPVPVEDVGTAAFAEHWESAIKLLAQQKNRKFINHLDSLLRHQAAKEPCRVCHRDDADLKPLGGDGPLACSTCNAMLALGQQLFKVGAVVRTGDEDIPDAAPVDKVEITIGPKTIYYHFFKGEKPLIERPRDTYFINNWNLELYRNSRYQNPTPLLLGNFGQQSPQDANASISAAELADCATGIKRVGHLRMDVDRLGQIFARGLDSAYNLPRLSGLSRQMSYFFKVYLNSLAENRIANLPPSAKQLSKSSRENLLFIYAGGDDLFVSGAWDEVIEFAFDVYQSFRAFTGHHPDITLSGGVSLSGPKYPLYQAAKNSGDAEEAAKNYGRDSFTLFDQTFKWSEWLGAANIKTSALIEADKEAKDYLDEEVTLDLHGILPFVEKLDHAFRDYIPRSFVRNMLATAQLQEQQIKTAKEKQPEQVKAIKYFLHLPKVAYLLARLPGRVRAAPDFELVSRSLKSPYNAPYFRAIATWLDLLNRSANRPKNNNGTSKN